MGATSSAKATQVILVSHKSVGIAILLTIFFGPLGLLYATVRGALTLIVGMPIVLTILASLGFAAGKNNGAAGLGTLGLCIAIFALSYPVSIIWSVIATNAYNKKLTSQVAS